MVPAQEEKVKTKRSSSPVPLGEKSSLSPLSPRGRGVGGEGTATGSSAPPLNCAAFASCHAEPSARDRSRRRPAPEAGRPGTARIPGSDKATEERSEGQRSRSMIWDVKCPLPV